VFFHQEIPTNWNVFQKTREQHHRTSQDNPTPPQLKKYARNLIIKLNQGHYLNNSSPKNDDDNKN